MTKAAFILLVPTAVMLGAVFLDGRTHGQRCALYYPQASALQLDRCVRVLAREGAEALPNEPSALPGGRFQP